MDIQQLVNAVATASTEAFNMAWEVLWPLILVGVDMHLR